MNIVPHERIERRILMIRGQKVLLDIDLAALYEVPAKALKQAVRRNRERFPEDFLFELTWEEVAILSRSQFVTLKQGANYKAVFDAIRDLMAEPKEPARERIGFRRVP